MKRAMTGSLSVLVLSLALAGTAAAQSAKLAIKRDGKTAGHAIGHGAREVGHATRDVALKVGHGARDAGRGIGKGARQGWDATRHGVKELFHKGG